MSVMSRLQMCTQIPKVTRDRTFGQKSTVVRVKVRVGLVLALLILSSGSAGKSLSMLALAPFTMEGSLKETPTIRASPTDEVLYFPDLLCNGLRP
jgi:hypothetical protein